MPELRRQVYPLDDSAKGGLGQVIIMMTNMLLGLFCLLQCSCEFAKPTDEGGTRRWKDIVVKAAMGEIPVRQH